MSSTKTRNYPFLVVLGLVSVLFFLVIRPFAYPIFWATVLAAMFHPVFKKFDKSLRQTSISALFTILLVFLIIIVPLSIIGVILVREVVTVYNSLNSNQGLVSGFLQSINNFFHNNPYLSRFNIDNTVISQRLDDLSRGIISFTLDSVRYITQNSLEFLVLFFLVLYMLFYLLRDGEKLLQRLMHLIPVGRGYEEMFYNKFISTINATLKGTLLVGAVQGVTGAVLFWLTGVPSPLILGLIMGILGAIPVTGTFLVWLPTGVLMIAAGHAAAGIIILVAGATLISVVDNMLRPYLVGMDLQMHPVLILLSMLGGVVMFGLTGFVLGPIIATLFLSLWEIYDSYLLKENGKN